MTKSGEAEREAFLKILAHRTMLKAYLLAIVKDYHLAEDSLSDTTVEILKSWSKFDPRLDFGPWARGIARRVALSNLRKRNRKVLLLSEEVLESLGSKMEDLGSEAELEERKSRLKTCIEKLPSESRDLIKLRYFEGNHYSEIENRTGRTRSALYMAFSRIHKSLADCIGVER